jgi:hypothetical protein
MAAARVIGRSSTEMAGLARLNLALTASVDLKRVVGAFGSPEAPWLGERAPDGPPGIRRFSCDLELHVSPERRALFRKAAIVGLGEPRPADDTWIIPIEWFAATFAPLFPIFVGELRIRTDRVELHGSYVPPGGAIGFVLDRALLGVAARGTGRWFLRKAASVLADPSAGMV